MALAVPDFVESLMWQVQSQRDAKPLVVEFPALAGRPHPASAAEQRLEDHLSRCEWAAGRVWNQRHPGHPLEPSIRVDLMWPELRCAVEIDGPDHRGSLKYADDRRRDNMLVLAGFAVLRFTNSEVADDPARVAATIATLLRARRCNERATT
jgi:very-short-patch-repair endonuclease